RMARAMRGNSSVPTWVVIKTGGTLRRTPSQRNWRQSKLKP
ncbi:MAG: 50S ribosomal protein L39e, partial [Candidatus Thorarchaeota archaeon]|nr:50S ribosomal protein L39e [Candidatus Thorarchaeota archaeon]